MLNTNPSKVSDTLQASVTLRVQRVFHVLCLAAIFSLPGCGGGDSVEPEPQNVALTAHASSDTTQAKAANAKIRITGASSRSGWYGDSIELTVSGLGPAPYDDVEVLLGGHPISPTSVDSGRVEFVLPDELPDDVWGFGLHVRARGLLSNGVPFSIAEINWVMPREGDWIEYEGGIRVVTTYFIVKLHEDHSSAEVAERIARSISAECEVIGNIKRWWQISVPTGTSVNEIRQIAKTVSLRPEVEEAREDFDLPKATTEFPPYVFGSTAN